MNDPVPAIVERDAKGEIAEIYIDIRRVFRIGGVNLIWRHLATLPGVLPWAWKALRPLYVDGTFALEAAALRGALDLPGLPAFPSETLIAAGLAEGDLAQIRTILAAYDRTNVMALIALLALHSRIRGAPDDPCIGSGVGFA